MLFLLLSDTYPDVNIYYITYVIGLHACYICNAAMSTERSWSCVVVIVIVTIIIVIVIIVSVIIIIIIITTTIMCFSIMIL